MTENRPEFYTVVFKGDGRALAKKLYETVEPFGEVIAIAVGNALDDEPATAKAPSHE